MKKFYFLGLAYSSIFILPILLSISIRNISPNKLKIWLGLIGEPLLLLYLGLIIFVGIFFYGSYKLFHLGLVFSTKFFRLLPLILGLPLVISLILLFTLYSNNTGHFIGFFEILMLLAIPLALIFPILGSTTFALFSEKKYFFLFFYTVIITSLIAILLVITSVIAGGVE